MPELLFNADDHHELTFSDVFMVPNNPVETRLATVINEDERDELMRLQQLAEQAALRSEQTINEEGDPDALLQADALEAVQAYRALVFQLADAHGVVSKVVSRDEVDFTPVDGFGNTPVVAANMNNVTGSRMAEAIGAMGGSAALPQDKSDEEMARIANYLHSRDTRYQTPITVNDDTPVWQLENAMQKRPLDTAIAVDPNGRMTGLVRMQQSKNETLERGIIPLSINKDAKVGDFLRRDGLISASEGISMGDALDLMERERVDVLPVLAEDGTLKGVITKKFAALSWRYRPHIDEERGGLAMLATVGAINKNPADRVRFLLDQGVKGIVFDTAHFDQGIETYRAVETAASIIANARKKVFLVAGNVVTTEAVRNILAAGANAAKVGIGPGAMCTTRMETGVGRPQFSAVLKGAEEARKFGGHVWADGGIMHPRDVALALAAGASQVMIGSMLTPTYESPSPFEKDERGLYKVNRGMASRESSVLRTLGSNGAAMRHRFRQILGQRSEGISESRIYARPGLESAMMMVHSLMDGVTSSMTYAGAHNLEEFAKFARIGLQSSSGYEEGKPKERI